MKLTFISDTHNHHSKLNLTSGDILIHCGDFTNKGSISDVENFSTWMQKQNFKYKIVISGNHDFGLEDERRFVSESLLKEKDIIYLNDTGIEIKGIKFWGSPVQPAFRNWAFNKERGEEIKKHWDLIPQNTDVLITHGPAFGILDKCKTGENVGCKELLTAVNNIKPKIHAFGHIHEAYGTQETNGIKFINASNLNELYQCSNLPISLEI
ncbi:MAG: metallophosphoesterase [Bdellovibrionales bacterium]|nr:metallophosphoesterase [Bdellovibrionales bacterium]